MNPSWLWFWRWIICEVARPIRAEVENFQESHTLNRGCFICQRAQIECRYGATYSPNFSMSAVFVCLQQFNYRIYTVNTGSLRSRLNIVFLRTKDGRCVSTSSHCTKVKPKYTGYERCRFAPVWSFGATVCAVATRQWSRGIEFPILNIIFIT